MLSLAGEVPAPAAPGAPPPPPGEDEAEYAWLPYDNIKPFAHGDVSGTGEAPVDPTLPLCIAAAEKALADDAARRTAGVGCVAWAWAGLCCTPVP